MHHGIDYHNDKLNEIFNLTWPNLNRNMQPYPDEMFEEAERREKQNKTLDEMTRQERVDAAIQEVWYLVQGGQDGREYANSILFIVKVLESLV